MNKLITFLAAIGLFLLNASASITPFEGSPRDGAVNFVIEDTVYVGLGNNASGRLTDFWKYTKGTDTWTQIADFTGTARMNAVAFTLNGKGYVGLGRDNYHLGNNLKDFYEYNPADNSWTKCTNDFGGTSRYSAVSFVIDEVAYVGTGEDDTGATSDFWSFNGTDWTQLSSTFSGNKRRAATSFVIEGKAYVTGGNHLDSYTVQLSDVQEYNPTTNTWSERIFAEGTKLPMNGATAFAYGGKGYICYGNMEYVTTFDPTTNNVDELGDKLTLGDNRDSPISFILGGFPYFGLGSNGLMTTTYHNDIIPFFETFTITFNGNGNNGGTAPQNLENLKDSTTILPDVGTLTKTGKRFAGWNTSNDGTGIHYNVGNIYTISASTTLFAEWFNEGEYLISEEGDVVVTNDGYFYDSGGEDSNHGDNENYVTTYYPNNANQVVKVNFLEFEIALLARLKIYNGTSTNATLLGFYEESEQLGTITAVNPDGALTFAFTSPRYYTTKKGWEAKIYSAQKYNVSFNIVNLEHPNVEVATIKIEDTTPRAPIKTDNGSANASIPFGNYAYSVYSVGYETYQGEFTVVDGDITEEITLIPTDTFLMHNSGGAVFVDDSAIFYDSGGKDGYHGKNEQDTVTLYPSQKGNVLQVVFHEFDLNPRANPGMPKNRLYIYNGTSTNSPLIGAYGGYDQIETITATNLEGALTFTFQSNSYFTDPGWKASISSLKPDNPFSADNLTITATSPVCGSSSGKITILSELTDLNVYFNDNWISKRIKQNVPYVYSSDDISPGTYTIRLEVLAGHIERNFTVVVPEYEEIKSTAIVQGNTVSFSIQGGEVPYQVQIDNDTYTTKTGKLTVNNLKSGTYSATIIDKNYCTDDTMLNFNIEQFNIYPNPVEGEMLYITLPNSLVDENCKINILTIDGNVIFTKNKIIKSTLSIDISNLNSNTYILKVNSGDYKNATQFIVK